MDENLSEIMEKNNDGIADFSDRGYLFATPFVTESAAFLPECGRGYNKLTPSAIPQKL